MEGISHLVSVSLARHGFTALVDHRRLQWSQWLRCESSLSVLPFPSKPGLFALAKEVGACDASTLDEKRVLTLFRISETEDLGMALWRLFLPNAPEREVLSTKPCYVRYAVIEDDDQRWASYRSLQCAFSNDVPNNLAIHSFPNDVRVEGDSKSAA